MAPMKKEATKAGAKPMSKGGIAEALAHDKKTSEKGSVVRIHDFAPDLAKVADALRHEFTDVEVVSPRCPWQKGGDAPSILFRCPSYSRT